MVDLRSFYAQNKQFIGRSRKRLFPGQLIKAQEQLRKVSQPVDVQNRNPFETKDLIPRGDPQRPATGTGNADATDAATAVAAAAPDLAAAALPAATAQLAASGVSDITTAMSAVGAPPAAAESPASQPLAPPQPATAPSLVPGALLDTNGSESTTSEPSNDAAVKSAQPAPQDDA